jgi:DNA-binding beta-propeller fold protein YncE
MMKRLIKFPDGSSLSGTVLRSLSLAVLMTFAIKTGAEEAPPLKLIHTIPLPGIEGDFDHFAVDLQGQRLFLAEEDHRSVEVFDLRTFKSIHSIPGFARPHWVLYIPESDELFVTDGPDENENLKIIKAGSYRPVHVVNLGQGADCIAYDPLTKYLYVAYGGRSARSHSSSIGIIDTTTGQHLGDIRIEAARLEGMDIDVPAKRLFVNITSKDEIGVIDLEKRKLVATWSLDLEGDANVPMRLDQANHRLFVATRTPTSFIVVDTDSGKAVSDLSTGLNADDIFYDAAHKRIYISCGEGFVDVFQQLDADHYKSLARVPTGPRARNSFFAPTLNLYFVPVPQEGNNQATILVYSPQP